ncbi:MAG: transglycosylase SLT domain-containing protein [Bdellovibrionota bacterium]|jgi:soluble lytic murein transglycosylase-like protein
MTRDKRQRFQDARRKIDVRHHNGSLFQKIVFILLILLGVGLLFIAAYLLLDRPQKTVQEETGSSIAEIEGYKLDESSETVAQRMEQEKEESSNATAQNGATKQGQMSPPPMQERVTFGYDINTTQEIHEEKVQKILSNIGVTESKELATQIVAAGRQTRFDPIFITALINHVSAFRKNSKSPLGRIGLLQIHPKALSFFSQNLGLKDLGEEKLFDVDYNLQTGLAMLRYLFNSSAKDMRLAIMASYWGEGEKLRIINVQEKVPAKVWQFATDVLKTYEYWKQDTPDSMKLFVPVRQTESSESVRRYPTDKDVIEKMLQQLPANNLVENKADLVKLILKHTTANQTDPLLISSLIEVLSKFNSQYVSEDGKVGLMQISPKKGDYIAKICQKKWKGEAALKDPDYNLSMGVAYFEFLQTKIFGSKKGYAILSYIWDPREFLQAIKTKKEIPAKFQKQLKLILERYKQLVEEKKTPLPEKRKIENPTADLIYLEELEKPELPIFEEDSIESNFDEEWGPNTLPKNEKPVAFESDVARISYIIKMYGLEEKDATRIARHIVMSAFRGNMDSLLVAAIVKEQSNFYWYAHTKKPVERIGLLQLTEAEGERMAKRSRVSWAGKGGLKDPEFSLRLMVSYVTLLRRIFDNNDRYVLSAFFWGLDDFAKLYRAKRVERVPENIKRKVNSVINTYNSWKKLYTVEKKKKKQVGRKKIIFPKL